MPDTATLPAAADPNDMEAMIAALDAPDSVAVAPVAPPTTIEAFQAQAPTAPAAPAEPVTAAPVETPAAPAAAASAPFDPTKDLDPNLAKNWRVSPDVRVTAQNAIEQTAFQLRRAAQAEGKTMSLGEAEQEAYKQLGLIVPPPAVPAAAPAAPEPAPAAPADPLAKINADIEAVRQELRTLNPVLDAERYTELMSSKDDLMDQRAEMRADFRVQQALQEREDIGTQATAAEQQFAEVAGKFEDLQDEKSEFFQRFAALHNANVQADAPALADENYERTLAAQVAGEFILNNKPFKVKGAATPPAGSPAPTGTPPAVAPPAARSTAPAPAPMAALPGNHTAPTSEHRVTVQQSDPAQAQQQQLQQAVVSGGMDEVLAALDQELGGPAPQGSLKILSIE